MLVPVDACHVRQVKDRALIPRTEQEVGGLRRAGLDLIPNSLHHRSDALRRKDTRGHYVAFAYAEASRRVNSLEQRLLYSPRTVCRNRRKLSLASTGLRLVSRTRLVTMSA